VCRGACGASVKACGGGHASVWASSSEDGGGHERR